MSVEVVNADLKTSHQGEEDQETGERQRVSDPTPLSHRAAISAPNEIGRGKERTKAAGRGTAFANAKVFQRCKRRSPRFNRRVTQKKLLQSRGIHKIRRRQRGGIQLLQGNYKISKSSHTLNLVKNLKNGKVVWEGTSRCNGPFRTRIWTSAECWVNKSEPRSLLVNERKAEPRLSGRGGRPYSNNRPTSRGAAIEIFQKEVSGSNVKALKSQLTSGDIKKKNNRLYKLGESTKPEQHILSDR